MRRASFAVMLLLASVAGVRPARAQATRGSAKVTGARASKASGASRARGDACPLPDTTATWYRRQRAWMLDGATYSDTAFRSALLAVPVFNRDEPSGALLGFEFDDSERAPVTPADAAMISRLVALGAQRGSVWPTRSVVGSEGVLAVWSLAGRDTTLARVALKRMMEAGPDESPPAAVALLEDRLRLRAGRKQLYGTQVRAVPSTTRGAAPSIAMLPVEDTAHLALRRDGAELPPLAQSLCAARSASARAAAARASTDH